MTKRCTRCGQEKPISEFHKDASKGDGLHSSCITCARERKRQWRKANPEKMREWQRQYREANRERIREHNRKWHKANPDYDRTWREANREKFRERNRLYYEANRDKAKIKKARRKARKKALPATLTDAQWKEILASFGFACAYCGTPWHELKGPLHQDHVVPLDQGGPYTAANIVPACPSCNLQKGPRTPEQADMALVAPLMPR